MPGQFKIKNGLIIDNGGISVTGSILSHTGITGSFSGSIAGFPTDVSGFSSSLSGRLSSNESKTGSFATTSSNTFYGNQSIVGTGTGIVFNPGSGGASIKQLSDNNIQTLVIDRQVTLTKQSGLEVSGSLLVSGSITSTGTITAQTLVVQTVTSSIDFVTGSTRFGSTIDNTHVFTGSIQITSGSINNAVYSIGGNYTQWSIGDYTYNTNYNTLELKAATEPRIYLNTDGGGNAVLYNSYGNVGLYITSGSYSNDIFYYDHYYGGKSLSIGAGGSTRMFISGSGNVGIGTTSPTSTIHVYKTSFPVVQVDSGTVTGNIGIDTSNSFMYAGTTTNHPLILGSNNTERVRIVSGGSVGIGVSTPSTKLHVSSTSGSENALAPPSLGFANSSSVALFTNYDAAYGTLFGTTNAGKGWIQQQRVDGTATSYTLTLQPSGGNVGIGTLSPGTALEVNGSITVTTSGGSVIWKNTGSSDKRWDFSSSGNNFSLNETGVNNRVTFQAGGFVGIGTTSPGTKFQVRDTTSAWVANFENNAGTESVGVYLSHGDGYGIAIDSSENDSKYIFKAMAGTGSGGGRGSVPVIFAQHDGKVGIGTSSPGSRLQIGDAGTAPNGVATLTLTGANTAPQIATKPGLYHRHAVGLGVFSDYAISFQVNGSTSLTDALFIKNDGTVGIGTTNPSRAFVISAGGGQGLEIDNPGAYSRILTYNRATSTYTDLSLAEGTSKVGIGVTNPSSKLDVNGDVASLTGGFRSNKGTNATVGQGSNFYLDGSGGYTMWQQTGTNKTSWFQYISGGWGEKMYLDNGSLTTTGNITAGGTLTENSSIRYKENIETLTSGLDKITQMRGVSYTKKDTQTKEIGVIAEEINDILPDVVVKNENGQPDSVSYGRLTAILIEAVKELKAEIDVLKSK